MCVAGLGECLIKFIQLFLETIVVQFFFSIQLCFFFTRLIRFFLSKQIFFFFFVFFVACRIALVALARGRLKVRCRLSQRHTSLWLSFLNRPLGVIQAKKKKPKTKQAIKKQWTIKSLGQLRHCHHWRWKLAMCVCVCVCVYVIV